MAEKTGLGLQVEHVSGATCDTMGGLFNRTELQRALNQDGHKYMCASPDGKTHFEVDGDKNPQALQNLVPKPKPGQQELS